MRKVLAGPAPYVLGLEADKISLVNESLTPVADFTLFYEGHKGKRAPQFKYSRRQDLPGTIMDIILLPLFPDDPMVKMFSSFDLPTDRGTHEFGADLTMHSRRSEFPAPSVASHVLTIQNGIARQVRIRLAQV